MSDQYLLSCHCGRQIAIAPRQAGETIECCCGAKLQVPTMREITALEPAPTESGSPLNGKDWGWRQQVRLLGVLLVFASIVIGAVLFLNRPVSPFKVLPPEVLQRSAQKLTPLQTWNEWEAAKRGLDRRIDQKHADAMVRFHIWLTANAVLALLGIGLIAAPMLVRPRPAVAVAEDGH